MNRKVLITVCFLVALAGCDVRSKEQLQEIEEVKRQAREDPGSIDAINPSTGLTLLHLAVLDGFPDLVEWLLDHKANINGKDSKGQAPLYSAMIFDHTPNNAIVGLLLKRGADPNTRTSYGDTPLHSAASFGLADKARLLLSHGADVNARARRSETPLHYASRVGSEKIQNITREKDLEEAAGVLLRYHADINAKDSNGATPLHGAVMVGNEDMVRFLVAQGANVNPANNHAATPLHIAAMFGRVQEAEILLEHGASTSVLDEEGRTPLEEALVHPAITCRATGSQPVEVSEVVRILKKYGAQEHGR